MLKKFRSKIIGRKIKIKNTMEPALTLECNQRAFPSFEGVDPLAPTKSDKVLDYCIDCVVKFSNLPGHKINFNPN